ncbi:MAG: twin-arginine translocase subunit TatC [Acidobacteriota bacterium]
MDQQHDGNTPPENQEPIRYPDDPEHGLDPEIQPATPPALVNRTPPPPPPTPPAEEEDEDESMLRMSFLEHLEELRARLISILVGAGVAFAVSMIVAVPLWEIIQKPLRGAVDQLHGDIVAITPMEQFTIIWMWAPLLLTIYLAAPWILYQVWAFIAPGLYPRERRWAAPFILVTVGLFLAGGSFAYFVALPFAMPFLLGLGAPAGVKPMISIEAYYSIFVNVILGVSVLFELPVVVFFLTLLRVVTPGFLMRNSRYAILLIVILAAIVTPTPDPVNLALFAIPMILLFFLGVFASYLLVLNREGQQFPWKALGIWIGSVLFLVAATVAVAVLQYGYHLIPNWPFVTK